MKLRTKIDGIRVACRLQSIPIEVREEEIERLKAVVDVIDPLVAAIGQDHALIYIVCNIVIYDRWYIC